MMHPSTSVFVTLPVLLVGGTEMQTLHQVRVLVNAGYRVTVCCYFNEYDPGMVGMMESAGARVILTGFDRSDGNGHLLKKLKAFFAHERPDIVHVQYIAPGFIPILAARLAGVRTVFATVHQPGRPYGLKARLLLCAAARMCAAFFCNSLSVERSWFGDAAFFAPDMPASRRHWTIYNAVDVERIATLAAGVDVPAVRNELGLGPGPVIGCVGRLRHEKGQAVLLDAMAAVLREFPSAMLLVVGDGPDRTSLEKKAEGLGFSANVVWLGRQDADAVFRLLGVMDVVVVPSHFEGFGLVAAEAMAAGLPVVASRVDGLAEVVADGETGLVVPPGDAEALARGIVTLLGDADLLKSFGRKAQAMVRRKFSLETFAQAILTAYRQVPHD